MKKDRKTFFVPLSLKIFILTLSISIVVSISLHQLFGKLLNAQQEKNLKSNQLTQTDALLRTLKKDLGYYISMAKILMQHSNSIDQNHIQTFFETNPDILYIAEGTQVHRANPSITNDHTASIRQLAVEALAQPVLGLGIMRVENFSYILASRAIGLTYRHSLNDEQIFILVNPSSLLSHLKDPTKTGQNLSFIVDTGGAIVLHPSFTINQSKANYSNFPIIKDLLENHITSNAIQQFHKNGNNHYLSSAVMDRQTNLLAVSMMARPPLLERRLYYSIAFPFFFLSCTVLAIIIYFFTRHLTVNLALLSKALLAIKNGDYSPILLSPSNDELGHLLLKIKALGLSLAQHTHDDNHTVAFSKRNFTKKSHLLADITNESKNVAVLFTNIHSFSSFSQTMSSQELIEFFNDYTDRMTTCITATNGQLYTIMGDKIIAIWGMHSSMGNPSKGAIDAALLMRDALMSFNLKRASSRLPAIKQGYGVSVGAIVQRPIEATNTLQHLTGSVIALASRLEALTKSFSVDIIASEPAFTQAGYYYHSQVLEKTVIKGEQIPQKIYSIEGKKSNGSSLFNIKERLSNASKVDKISLTTPPYEDTIK